MQKMSIAVISNIVFAPYSDQFVREKIGNNIEICYIPYGEHNTDEYSESLSNSNLIIVWLNYENLFSYSYNYIDMGKITREQIIQKASFCCERLYTDISRYTSAHIIWFTFEDYYRLLFNVLGNVYSDLIDRINTKINELFIGKMTIIDLKRLIAENGISKAYNLKGKYRWNAPYSKELIENAINEIYKQYLVERGMTKKCLILDCDNVLWGGILSEDGIDNIKLSSSGAGRIYKDFQQFVQTLYCHGVLLAICSKNDLSDVLKMFREHTDMIINERYISCFQVNWEDKPCNIKKIAENLNIGLDSIVFVDDSPVEVEAMKAILPDVKTIIFKKDMDYEQFSCFNLKSNTSIADVEMRNETYRANEFRRKLKGNYIDYNDYINALEIKLDIHITVPIEYNRISELTQRTNKCTNGTRYTVYEIKEHLVDGKMELYSVWVCDRFSDLGIVGAIGIEHDVLTLFSVSCRALGREIENKIIEFISNKFQIKEIEFKSTGRNEAFRAFLEEKFPNAFFRN